MLFDFYNLFQPKPDEFTTFFRQVDWYRVFNGVVITTILSIVGWLARLIWKKFKNSDFFEKKAKDTVKTAEQAKLEYEQMLEKAKEDFEEQKQKLVVEVENAKVSNRQLGQTNEDYRRSIETVMRNNRDMYDRLGKIENKVQENEQLKSRLVLAENRVSELEHENTRLKTRIEELEAVNKPDLDLRRKGTGDLHG
jgi:chromosome segregation ATPase